MWLSLYSDLPEFHATKMHCSIGAGSISRGAAAISPLSLHTTDQDQQQQLPCQFNEEGSALNCKVKCSFLPALGAAAQHAESLK